MIVPKPLRHEPRPGRLLLDDRTALTADPAFREVAAWLREQLAPVTGGELLPAPPGPGTITLARAELAPEAYRLTVGDDGALIEAGDAAGAFYGAQTFRQLLPAAAFRRAAAGGPLAVPGAYVEDAPRFGWRGCILDVARHFLTKHEVLRFIDLMALHKLNILHLHLTDDQGWRLEIRRYPRLTEVGAWRRESQMGWNGAMDGIPHGGYYTQDDIREIVAYAARRHITVVPEIDIPGHSQAAIAAYPELGNLDTPLEVRTTWGVGENVLNVEESTIEFFQHVFDEVLELFPGEYVCVGGDECRKDQWKASPAAQRRIRELGLRDEEELQSWFIHRFDAYLGERGRRLVGWDEILEGGLAPGAVVASWRGDLGAVTAARSGHDVVNCSNTSVYLDYRQAPGDDEPVPFGTVLTLEDVYAFDPVPAELRGDPAAGHVLGAQCGVWTELIDSSRRVDYMVFPRLAAFAETVWSAPERDLPGFRDRLAAHLPRLDAIGVEYRRADGPLPWQQRPGVPGRPEDPESWRIKIDNWTSNLRRQ
ncbi:beta-N-acetylhexosaminidase [Bailinhaonella thermotolerans]|uniref:beta-N-acetylhexosaminidase n=1 Tax=Bailinhaonella thermotolerans TaxID=1070861 RepID=A0A3A4B9R4_9ACTN|nr:beta-N-acetylhexosaminidase [Bailinhaonella thermotolerans]RJL35629.1 beta-N-acetylhexosaminidase [Bailinhaonella thermotolerans]